VAVGGNSEHYFRVAADALAALLPKVTVLTLPGQDHGAFCAAPEPIAEQIREFLLS
jgi:pimeloyl-ACP methyl ester carboxylesterase